jgi:hypothetical protein
MEKENGKGKEGKTGRETKESGVDSGDMNF